MLSCRSTAHSRRTSRRCRRFGDEQCDIDRGALRGSSREGRDPSRTVRSRFEPVRAGAGKYIAKRVEDASTSSLLPRIAPKRRFTVCRSLVGERVRMMGCAAALAPMPPTRTQQCRTARGTAGRHVPCAMRGPRSASPPSARTDRRAALSGKPARRRVPQKGTLRRVCAQKGASRPAQPGRNFLSMSLDERLLGSRHLPPSHPSHSPLVCSVGTSAAERPLCDVRLSVPSSYVYLAWQRVEGL